MFKRFRDRRATEESRERARQTRLSPGDFILPLFLIPGSKQSVPIGSMPGVKRVSLDCAVELLEPFVAYGLRSVLLFGVPGHKGIDQAWDDRGIVQSSIGPLRQAYPSLEIITDVCLCSFTDDGHCHTGDNDATCRLLARVAVSHARAGAHTVAPSAMMDGQVYFIRDALNREGHHATRIMSHAAKFASAFYGPFRDAAQCAPRSGDRRGYQIDPANGGEALEEIVADVEQGADSIIVKPALAYLDVIANASNTLSAPVIGYNVSGEYALLHAGVSQGILPPSSIDEALLSIRRAGATRIISYFTHWYQPEGHAA